MKNSKFVSDKIRLRQEIILYESVLPPPNLIEYQQSLRRFVEKKDYSSLLKIALSIVFSDIPEFIKQSFCQHIFFDYFKNYLGLLEADRCLFLGILESYGTKRYPKLDKINWQSSVNVNPPYCSIR